MRSRLWLNLVLAAAVAVLAAVAWFEPALEKPAEAQPVLALAPADVSTLRVERADGSAIAFERRDGNWWMVEPLRAPASDYRMQGVLNMVTAKSLAHYPRNQVELASVGLEPPAVRVVVNDKPVALGESEPLEQRRYVMADDMVHLVPGDGFVHLIGAFPTFLDTALLPPGAKVVRLELPGLLVSKEHDRWQVQPSPAGGFSVDLVNRLLESWRITQALEVRAYAADEHHGAAESVRVTLEGQEKPLEFLLLSREPLAIARPDLGVEYRFAGDAAKELLELPSITAQDHP